MISASYQNKIFRFWSERSIDTKIGVVGIGYVGLLNAVLLAKDHEVVILDVDVARMT